MSDPAYIVAFKELTKSPPTFSDLPSMEQEFYGDSPRASILLSATIVEWAIAEAVQRLLREHSEVRALFDFDAPLGTFSAKISIGFALNLFETKTKHDLYIIRVLRNGFAHCRLPLTFETSAVTEMCKNLLLPDTDYARAPQVISRVPTLAEVASDPSHPKMRYLTACHTIAVWLLDFNARTRERPDAPSLPRLP